MGPTINNSVETSTCLPDAAAAAKAGQIVGLAQPQFGHRIEIDAREGVFVVLRTDPDRGTVDVLRISGVRQIEAGIPMTSVRVLSGQNSADPFKNIDG